MEGIQPTFPTFPALHVHEDNSVGSLRSLDDWTHDVDQWFWSDPCDYLIDSLGMKFVQECERAPDRRPVDIRTLQNWEQGRREPEGPAKALLRVVEREPEAVLNALHA